MNSSLRLPKALADLSENGLRLSCGSVSGPVAKRRTWAAKRLAGSIEREKKGARLAMSAPSIGPAPTKQNAFDVRYPFAAQRSSTYCPNQLVVAIARPCKGLGILTDAASDGAVHEIPCGDLGGSLRRRPEHVVHCRVRSCQVSCAEDTEADAL